MRVVSARMHHADLLAVVRRAHVRAERHVDVLRHRQRVHVRAERNHRTRPAAAQHADDARMRHAGAHFVEPERAQMARHQRGRPRLAIAQLGMAVEVAPPGHHAGLDAISSLGSGSRRNVGLYWRRGGFRSMQR